MIERFDALAARSPRALLALFSAGGFLAIFRFALAGVPPESYQARDDAVITLSHARNLIDFGFVGVNPSGERLEGFSAPLQFALYVISYGATRLGPAAFFALQTFLCTAALGAIFYLLFELIDPRPLRALLFSLLAGALLTGSASFLLWHHSGMENALAHCLYLAAFAALLLALREGRPRRWIMPLLLCAAWCRTESILHLAPLVLLYAGVRRDRSGARLAGGFFAAWLAILFLKGLYFGELQPNTASAQLLSPGAALAALATGRMPLSRFAVAADSLKANLALLPLAAAPLLLWMPRDRESAFALGAFAVSAAAALLEGLLFGPARMDAPRTTTFLAVFSALASCFLLLRARLPPLLQLGLALLAVSPLASLLMSRQPYSIGWGAAAFESGHRRFLEIAAAERLPRPFLGNVNLGEVSYSKDFNVVDLGFIGSDVLARLNDPAATADYLLEMAQPDIVELGSHWACLYFFLLRDARFKALYQPLQEWRGEYLETQCPHHPEARDGLYLRRSIRAGSAAPERRLIDSMARELSSLRVREELALCQGNGPGGCLHVLRTVYRFLPEIRRAKLESEFDSLFQSLPDPSFRAWSLALLHSDRDGRLSDEALRFVNALRSRAGAR